MVILWCSGKTSLFICRDWGVMRERKIRWLALTYPERFGCYLSLSEEIYLLFLSYLLCRQLSYRDCLNFEWDAGFEKLEGSILFLYASRLWLVQNHPQYKPSYSRVWLRIGSDEESTTDSSKIYEDHPFTLAFKGLCSAHWNARDLGPSSVLLGLGLFPCLDLNHVSIVEIVLIHFQLVL